MMKGDEGSIAWRLAGIGLGESGWLLLAGRAQAGWSMWNEVRVSSVWSPLFQDGPNLGAPSVIGCNSEVGWGLGNIFQQTWSLSLDPQAWTWRLKSWVLIRAFRDVFVTMKTRINFMFD